MATRELTLTGSFTAIGGKARGTGATLAEGKGIPDAIKAGMDAAAGTSGNLLTRQDTSLNLLVHAGLAMAGGTAATYGGASAYMDKRHREAFNQAVNEFQLGYLADHGHYAPESYVVKHVLWKMTAEELWRANLPLPVVPVRRRAIETDLERDALS